MPWWQDSISVYKGYSKAISPNMKVSSKFGVYVSPIIVKQIVLYANKRTLPVWTLLVEAIPPAGWSKRALFMTPSAAITVCTTPSGVSESSPFSYARLWKLIGVPPLVYSQLCKSCEWWGWQSVGRVKVTAELGGWGFTSGPWHIP